jgi:hypothetical protein
LKDENTKRQREKVRREACLGATYARGVGVVGVRVAYACGRRGRRGERTMADGSKFQPLSHTHRRARSAPQRPAHSPLNPTHGLDPKKRGCSPPTEDTNLAESRKGGVFHIWQLSGQSS